MDITAGPVRGDRVRYYRKLCALTQEELAEMVGVAPTHITNIERGNKGVSLGVLLLICKQLDISPSDILPEAGGQNESEQRRKLISEVVGVMKSLDLNQLGIVKTMICSLRK